MRFEDEQSEIPTGETPTERAHRICADCGLDAAAIDWLIDETEHTTLDRAGALALWEGTYDDPDALAEARELCMPCVEAILDVSVDRAKREVSEQESQDEDRTERG